MRSFASLRMTKGGPGHRGIHTNPGRTRGPLSLYRRMADRLLIVDFGSQVTQLIARRVREAGVYCEIHPFQSVDGAKIKAFDPRGIILSGWPASVIDGQAPSADPPIFPSKVPVLGTC